MDEVLMEAQMPSGWTRIGSVAEIEPPGSISHDGPGGRQIMMFGFYDGEPGVWESQFGFAVENDAVRQITSLGLNRLSDLQEPFYVEVIRTGIRMALRFTLRTA